MGVNGGTPEAVLKTGNLTADSQAPHMSVEEMTHVLVVDDDPVVREACVSHLDNAASLGPEGTAVRFHTAGSGEEAVAVAREVCDRGERVSCALVNIAMPKGMDGLDTILALWGLDPAMHGITLTDAGPRMENQIETRIPVEYLGRWDYMSKPHTEFELVQRMRRALTSWYGQRRDELRSSENLELLLKLRRINRDLEQTVEERTRALAAQNEEQKSRNAELQQALRQLETAQTSLVQQEKLASIGQLAAGVAHELNNPIGYVHSNLGTLRRYSERIRTLLEALHGRHAADEELSALEKELKIEFILEDLPALIQETLEGTERVRKIVSDLKGFSRPSEQEPKYSDINDGLRSTLNIVHNEVKYCAQLETEFGEIPEVRCLIGAINQVFMNMLVNAVQALKGSGDIRVATRREGDDVVIEFSDTGCGMPQEVQDRIFDPFYTTKRVGKGTGLGLSISYDIVRKHGGTIDVESEVGKGTTFLIRLPIEGSGELDVDS